MTLKLIMPMAGEGSRFREQGYESPKPLIDVLGKPMFVRTIESIGLEFDDYIFIVRKEHNVKNSVLEYYPDAKVVELDALTEGAACSVATADPYIDSTDSVCICNCDQFFEWNSLEFENHKHNDGVILLFHDTARDPKWSFAAYEPQSERIFKVAEKDPISEYATAGLYYWRSWDVYMKSLELMMAANDRTNNEFYLCPTYNHTLRLQNTTISGIMIDEMHGVGTPEDLTEYLESINNG
jgi:NDP-sugar pyrophosphorylase family protein